MRRLTILVGAICLIWISAIHAGEKVRSEAVATKTGSKMQKTMFILYVADQAKSRTFYQAVLEEKPVLDVPGMTEFRLNDGASLGLMPEEGIAKILGEAVAHPKTGNGIPRCELYVFDPDPKAAYERLILAGGKKISAAKMRAWGDIVAYGADPDGHVLAFAKTP
jgi:lactoylglutathione lyase